MSHFFGLGAAPVFERGTFFNPGSIHDVQVGRCLLKPSEKSGVGFIVETEILTSAQTGEINRATNQPWIPLSVGTDGTWWQGMTDRNVALPAIKGFVHAILALDANDPRRGWLEQPIPGSEHWRCNQTRRPFALIESLMIWATEEPNIFQGMILHLDTKLIVTKKQKDFTIHNWNPQPRALPQNVDALLAQARTEPPIAIPNVPAGPAWGHGGPPAGQWGQPQGGPPAGYGQPPPAWGQPPAGPPAGYGQPPGPGQWGQPPGPPAAPPWSAQPPAGPPAQNWGPPPGQPPAAPPWGRR